MKNDYLSSLLRMLKCIVRIYSKLRLALYCCTMPERGKKFQTSSKAQANVSFEVLPVTKGVAFFKSLSKAKTELYRFGNNFFACLNRVIINGRFSFDHRR